MTTHGARAWQNVTASNRRSRLFRAPCLVDNVVDVVLFSEDGA